MRNTTKKGYPMKQYSLKHYYIRNIPWSEQQGAQINIFVPNHNVTIYFSPH